MKKIPAILLAAAVTVACAKSQPPARQATGDTREPELAAAEATTTDEDSPTRSQIAIDDRILKACGISDAEAFFDYDSVRVSQAGANLLKRLAVCFESGPLKGEAMKLVGHADSRGSDEYNMVLGSRRAESVKQALVGFGLSGKVVSTSTRGEMEATGVDQDSWSQDRRVDVLMGA